MVKLRTVIVDDEAPARALLRALLSAWPDVDIVAEAGDGNAALAAIRAEKPDLVFLDVQIPGPTGIDIAAEMAADESPPLIVFVTAFDQYAIKAFEVSACDYLLKPFDAERLAETLQRVIARRQQPDGDIVKTLRTLVAKARRPRSEPVVVKTDGRHVFLDQDEIEWVEAVGKEVRVHVGASALTVRESMQSIESRLDPACFVRVQRSAIVNRAHIREVQPWFKGDYVLILRRGTRVTSGRTYRTTVQRLMRGDAGMDA